ncbi:hypothetical protein [Luteococcus sp.]|uniref:hypothetical protein n=1 Tax=Luteococcus sp. TaxID=1969402 RepID=UPI0037356546
MACRLLSAEAASDPAAGTAEVEASPTFELRIARPDAPKPFDSFLVGVRIDAQSNRGRAAVWYEAHYALTGEPEPVGLPLLTQFANEVAVMVLLPYLREGLADVTRRVWGSTLLVPMMQRGQLVFSVPSQEG